MTGATKSQLIVRSIFAACLAGTSLLGGCSSPTSSLPPLASAEPGTYRIDAGDKLHIVIQDLAAANGDYLVEDGGTISLPYLKRFPVAGMTYREIEQNIAATLLRQGIMTGDPVVNVAPVQLRPFYVLGEVNRPGEFDFRHGMTVLSALSAAGGYTYRANTKNFAITRLVNGVEVNARATEDTPIQPGDRIRVYERWF